MAGYLTPSSRFGYVVKVFLCSHLKFREKITVAPKESVKKQGPRIVDQLTYRSFGALVLES